jgi:very-short-patch-repair endonuclease
MELLHLDIYARDHHGLVTRAAAKRAGISAATWYRALEQGLLEPLHRNVARMYGAEKTTEQVIAAAVLAAGDGALASHRSAAFLWGIPRPDGEAPDVMLVKRSRRASVDGAHIHRPRDHLDLKPVLRKNIRTTNILRTLCDLGALDPESVRGAVGHVVTTGLASPVALRRAVGRHARQGRAGVPALRNALDEWVIDGKPVDSVLEPAMRKLVKTHKLPPVEFHPIVGGYEVDFRIVGTDILLECDGWESHGLNKHQFEKDKTRDAELIALGNIVVRFTYRGITRRAAREAERIRRVVVRWAPSVLLGADLLSS